MPGVLDARIWCRHGRSLQFHALDSAIILILPLLNVMSVRIPLLFAYPRPADFPRISPRLWLCLSSRIIRGPFPVSARRAPASSDAANTAARHRHHPRVPSFPLLTVPRRSLPSRRADGCGSADRHRHLKCSLSRPARARPLSLLFSTVVKRGLKEQMIQAVRSAAAGGLLNAERALAGRITVHDVASPIHLFPSRQRALVVLSWS